MLTAHVALFEVGAEHAVERYDHTREQLSSLAHHQRVRVVTKQLHTDVNHLHRHRHALSNLHIIHTAEVGVAYASLLSCNPN